MWWKYAWVRQPKYSQVDLLDFSYDVHWQERGLRLRDHLTDRERVFLEWIEPGSRVADVGCGNSPMLLQLAQTDCEVVGLVSPRVVDI